MNRPFIAGVDLDGVCGDYITGLKTFIAADRGISPDELTDDVSWNCPEWGLTREEYEEYHLRAVQEHRLFLNMPIFRGASEALWELSNAGVWIRIITHRLFLSGFHAIVANDTVQWLDNSKSRIATSASSEASKMSAPIYTLKTTQTKLLLYEPMVLMCCVLNSHTIGHSRPQGSQLGRGQGNRLGILPPI